MHIRMKCTCAACCLSFAYSCGSDGQLGVIDAGADSDLLDVGSDPDFDAAACDARFDSRIAPNCMGCPGERPGGNCTLPVPDGGIYGRCREDGEEIGGKVLGAYCCNHADAGGYIGYIIPSMRVADGGDCVQTAPPDILICSICGDGICPPWENRCSCPADCP